LRPLAARSDLSIHSAEATSAAPATNVHTSSASEASGRGSSGASSAAAAAASGAPAAMERASRPREGTLHLLPLDGSGLGSGITIGLSPRVNPNPSGCWLRKWQAAGMKCSWIAVRVTLVGLAAACQVRPLKAHASPSRARRRT